MAGSLTNYGITLSIVSDEFKVCFSFGEQGWHSGESARLPPVCPGFDSQTWRHMWVEFVVGSRPCSEYFSPGSLVFLPPQNPAFLNSNSIRNSRATGKYLLKTVVFHPR